MLRSDVTWLSRITANAWIGAVGATVVTSGLVAAFGSPSHPFSTATWFLTWIPLAAIGLLPALPVAWTLFRHGDAPWFREDVGRPRFFALWSMVAFEGLAVALFLGVNASH